MRRDTRRVMILDDDPTGTQTVAGVEVILRPRREAYQRFFAGRERAIYVLTNSRALGQAEAVAFITRIRAEAEQAAQEAGERVAFLLRGDSTLRGHVFAEIDALAAGRQDAVSLFVPAFPEGGRITSGGIHYLLVDGKRVPVARTEFAQDSTFGYRSERLSDWVAEVGKGRSALSIPLEELRTQGSLAVCRALLQAEAGSVIVPDAETREDLESIADGLLEAEERGRQVVVRSASTFAAIRAGLQGRTVLPALSSPEGRVLLVCGSHTAASSRQLENLVRRSQPPAIIPTERLLSEGPDTVIPLLARQLGESLREQRFAILATERVRRSEHGALEIGARVMEAVVAIVARVAGDCDAVISKGGITSAQVATDGLPTEKAWVEGQLEPGVSLWELTLKDGRRIPYAVVPGNVGHEQTLVDIARQFHVAPLRPT